MTNIPVMSLATVLVFSATLQVPAFATDAAQSGTSFVENFDKIDQEVWYISDGWDNGGHQNCTWSKTQATVQNGLLELTYEQRKAGKRDYVCGEIQTRKRFGFGTYEARIKTAEGSGLNSAFFTYIGPTDKKPHDEIDFEVLGKDSGKVQVNQYVSGKGGNEKLVDVGGDASAGFNDYAFVWQQGRLRYYLNGVLVQDVTDPAKIPVNAQKIFFSLWGTDTLSGWMGKFDYKGPATMQIDRIAFTAPGDKCMFPKSVTCTLN
ncbi:glycoside hydrolase family 16 protein (plasmid) [Rhizobium sp. 32-5/1]|uniref:endo-1,3-1,4-beta-glycanase ExoK n=1 Tax=Rhizobium sp. 32-5/1 TaxID=3019602 RepID=UPI00240D5C82|nr:glycoside hydrolase family 16 protein [Rhizobium sp. 32-5/1]WEZ85291.1 glycoside hydrolase family 16 protein [Rhizobium sp. 32-5/1]